MNIYEYDIKIQYTKRSNQVLNGQQPNEIECRYSYKKHFNLDFNGKNLVSADYLTVENLVEKHFQLPGLGYLEYIEAAKSSLSNYPLFIERLADNDFYDNLRTLSFVVFIINLLGAESGHALPVFDKFLNDNIQINYINKYNVALPIVYFLPWDQQSPILENLFQKRFLNKLRVSYLDDAGAECKQEILFKPPITPTAKIYLEETEYMTFHRILKMLDQKLREKEG